MNTNNSISSVIKQLLEINVNSLKTFERINEAVTTDKQTVPLELLTEDGTTKTVYVPAFGYMRRELERLDANIRSLTDLTDGTSKLKLADGTYQRIYTGTLKSPANDITALNRPTKFETKQNYFFEDFLTPLLTVNFDVTNQIQPDTERVLVKRLIIDTSFDFAAEYFNTELRGKDGLAYDTVIADLAANNIPFYDDEEVRDLPYKSTQYYGTFDVTSIDNVQREVLVNGTSTTQNIKLYTLDQLNYTDGEKGFSNTETLRAGDELMVNSGKRSTKYRVKNIDTSTRQVELELVQGYEAIKIGADQLRIYKASEIGTSVEINVGFDESIVVFVKAIDPDSNILAENWSPGAAIYSNDLTITLENGTVQSLGDYYKEEVADFGQFIKALKEDAIPPATLGKTPDSPNLEPGNFTVVQINKHLTDNDAANKIKKLTSDKINTEEKLKQLDDTIAKKTASVSTNKYPSAIAKDRDVNELSSLINERDSTTKLYSSLVNEINAISSGTGVANIEPKFRVRGFWTIPDAKIVAETIPQQVVQFIVQYRYVSTSGKTSEIAQIPVNENGTQKTGVFSNWNEVKTGVRQRLKDETTGKFYWADTAIEDGQEVNFNQLDIPIQKGEVVEVRIKSISEAGYPANPIMSDWSETVRIEFPEGQLDTVNVSTLVEKNQTESAIVRINDQLTSKGVYRHINDAFTANEKYFAHNSTTIASGFLSPEQTPISLFDKLTELENEITALQETISGIKGELTVKLVTEEGTVININKNTNNKVFAGYYTDEVADLNVKKGHIVTKTFKLLLENTNATQLELIARIMGDRSLPTFRSSAASSNAVTYEFGVDPGSGSGIPEKVINDTFYTTEGKYDVVPVQYQNVSSDDLLEKFGTNPVEYNHLAPYQSAQRRGQFIYSRFMDISAENGLYFDTPAVSPATSTLADYEYLMSYDPTALPVISNSGSDFIWNGTFGTYDQANDEYDVSGAFGTLTPNVTNLNTITSSGYDGGIYLHKNHPDLENIYAAYQASAITNTAMTATEVEGVLGNQIKAGVIGTMSVPATFQAEDANGKKQLGYKHTHGLIGLINGNSYDRTLKMSFDANDQYLLGGKSCGSYLFISPINSESLLVDGDNKFGRKYVTTGESNAVSIDVVYQYRMTDYAGNDPATDLGRIGGIMSTNLSNLTYAKRIGIDVFDADGEQFSFDIEVFAKYKPSGTNKNSIKAAQLSI
jgi:hypothetical protein